MKNSISILMKHNLDVSSFCRLKNDLQNKLNVSILITSSDPESPHYNKISVDYNGWLLNVYNYPANVELYLCGKNDKRLVIWEYYVDVQGLLNEGFDWRLNDWLYVTHWLYPRHFEYKWFMEKRKQIYDLTQIFGADNYLMLDGEKYLYLCDSIGNGTSLRESINQYETQMPVEKVIINNGKQTEKINKSRNLKIESIHDLKREDHYLKTIRDYYKLFDYIFTDDFRDYEK